MGALASKTLDPNDISLDLNGLYGYQNVVVHTSQVLGAGSYGSVVKATLDQVPCAAKILHKIFLDSQDPGLTKFITSFEQECQILCDLKHPSIVQFLGVVQDPNTKKPILLMELMKESLTGFLESSPANVPYHLQVNISHDIALAVAHLHRNGILHRDLSSNNILLNENHKAKVTDFGMSKISSSDPSMTRSRVTQCPGTLVYMPPEALRPQPRYSDKIDSFSIGVLLIQIATRNFPAPTEASITRDDPNSPTGESYIPVSEIERRRSDIVIISASHGFLSIINNCLKDKSQDRPSAAQLCQNLGELKNTQTYSDSVKEHIIMTTPFEGRTELHDAAERGDVKAVQRLLNTSLNINSRTEDEGRTSLHLASIRGHVEVVRLLVQAHALVNIQEKDGSTPLYWASGYGHTAVVELLLLNNADVSICDEKGYSPLYVASQEGHTDVVDILLRKGADVNQTTTNENENVPLEVAALNGHTQTVQRLLEAGAIINYQNKNGISPLYAASQEGHTDVVDILLRKGADVNQTTTEEYESVPLGIAAQEGHTQTVQRLLEAGANINQQNKKNGATALLVAAMKGHSETVKLLLVAGARDITDKFGDTGLSIARTNNHIEVVRLLQQPM